MPYQRIADKQAAQQQQQPQPGGPMPGQQGGPMPAPGAEAPEDLSQRRVTRGAMDLNQPMTPSTAARMAQESVRPGAASIKGGDQEASAQEQDEYERALKALSKVLYEDERASDGIIQQLLPEERVGSVAKASMLIINQLDAKLDFDEDIIAQLTQDTVERVIDLFENTKLEDEFSEQEAQAALGATWEGIMEMYGVDEDSYAELTSGLSEDEFKGYETQYKQFLGEA